MTEHNNTMVIDTDTFGAVHVELDRVLNFPDGLIGVPAYQWILISRNDQHGPFLFLQSVDVPELVFPVVRPEQFVPDYHPHVHAGELDGIVDDVDAPGSLLVISIVRSTQNLEEFTVNLQAPVVISESSWSGRQVITMDDWNVRTPLWSERTVDDVQANPLPPIGTVPVEVIAKSEAV